MSFRLPKVYPLTDVALSGLSHAEQVRRLAAGGATIVQLREKKMPAKDFFNEALAAIRVAKNVGVRIIINDRVDIALATRADGVHLGQDDLPVKAARCLLGPEAIIGLSTHNLDQVAAALKEAVDYLAIGPIFATSSKDDTEPEVGISGLRQVRRLAQEQPLVAIGGISELNAAAVIEAGATSAAVISALLSAPNDIAERTRRLIEKLS